MHESQLEPWWCVVRKCLEGVRKQILKAMEDCMGPWEHRTIWMVADRKDLSHLATRMMAFQSSSWYSYLQRSLFFETKSSITLWKSIAQPTQSCVRMGQQWSKMIDTHGVSGGSKTNKSSHQGSASGLSIVKWHSVLQPCAWDIHWPPRAKLDCTLDSSEQP